MLSQTKKSHQVMVTFGRGCAELLENFDKLVEKKNHTRAGLALDLIREGVERHMAVEAAKKQN